VTHIARRSVSRMAERTLLHAFLIVGVVISMLPFYWMIISSLKGRGEVFVVPPRWWFTTPVFGNYPAVFRESNFATGFLNTCFVTFTKTAVTLLLSAMAGFAFAKYDFPGRDGLFLFLLGTMMIPGVVTMIPSYMIMVEIKWIDTYQALIVPGLASAFGTFLMRQYMYTVPDELLDAARIDGSGDFRLFFQIALPIAVPALTSLAIFSFFGNWNDLFWPMIVIRSKPKFTLPLSLMLLRSRFPHNVDYPVVFAASFMATLPTLIVFFFLQRHFVSGITAGALRG
jgi:ABC-type glycerol-3-phosphate transport system permease component